MSKTLTAILIGAGNRGTKYTNIMEQLGDKYKVVAVAEPIDSRRNYVREKHGIPEEMCFTDWKPLLALGKIADIAVITSDNPRTEDPNAILEDILKGVNKEKNNYEVIENRVRAIHHAMDIAKKNDIIVLAGKGHETYQEIHGVKHHLDEREIVASYLEETRE